MSLFGRTAEDRAKLVLCVANDHRSAFFDDARLLAGDLRQRRAEVLHVVVVYGSNDAQHRLDDVRRVQASAKAGLDHGHINTSFGEVLQCHRRCDLEERTTDRCRGVHQRSCKPSDRIIVDHGPIHTDPFIEAADMGRGVHAYAIPCVLQDAGKHGTRRSFAVGASNVDDGISAFGMIDRIEQCGDAIQSGLDAVERHREELVEKRLDGHDCKLQRGKRQRPCDRLIAGAC